MQEAKKKRCEYEGIEYVPQEFKEEKQRKKYVQIEVEEIIYITTEGESSSEKEEN